MNGPFGDKYVLFSVASISIVVLVCAVGPFMADGVEGNGMTEIGGVISEPARSQNGTVFKLTDLDGKEIRCFYGSEMPATPVLCRLIGSFSNDGSMFFVNKIVVNGMW